jgi:hypothetical protein
MPDIAQADTQEVELDAAGVGGPGEGEGEEGEDEVRVACLGCEECCGWGDAGGADS